MASAKRTSDERPGAMTLAMRAFGPQSTEPKVLRLGIVTEGTIVDEQVLDCMETVWVGSDASNRFVVKTGEVGVRFPLFEATDSGYVLNFRDGTTGRVSQRGGVRTFDELAKHDSFRTDSGFRVTLDASARGKVVIGDVAIVFQFVTPRVKPPIPIATQGAFARSIDWIFTAFVLVSYMGFFGFVVYLENTDWAYTPPSNEIPDLVARYVFNEPQAPPEPPEFTRETSDAQVETADNIETVEIDEVQVVERTSQRERPTTSSSTNVGPVFIDQASVRDRVTEAMNLTIGAEGATSGGFERFLEGPVMNSQEVLATAERVTGVTFMSGLDARSGASGSGETRRIGDIASGMAGGMRITTDMVLERRIRPVVPRRPIDPIDGAGVFDPSVVVRTIGRRSARFQHCYERELPANPSLEGRVSVRFTIQPRGNVTNVQATGNSTGSDSLASCVLRTVQGIRFVPGPEGGSVTFAYPFMFALQR